MRALWSDRQNCSHSVSQKVTRISYASWGPIFWPFLRSTARDTTIKAVRGAVAIRGNFDN